MLLELATWLEPPHVLDGLELPVTRLEEISWFEAIRSHPVVKALIPIPVFLVAAPIIWWLFRGWWREADEEATRFRSQLSAEGRVDNRPLACLLITAIILTLQEYYGGRQFYDSLIRPALSEYQAEGHTWIKFKKWDEFYGYVWWSGTRIAGYTIIPFGIWKLLFPKDSLLDMGLRVRGFISHIWIYGVCFLIVVAAMGLVATQPEFLRYYPFYKHSSRSWHDLMAWQSIYWLQFLGLEAFFRGWMVGAMRHSLGSASVLAMAVPYCMIHYGKPYEEAQGAIIAGVFLGSLALKTRSIWGGLLVHIAVAVSMDLLSLWSRGAIPKVFWAPG